MMGGYANSVAELTGVTALESRPKMVLGTVRRDGLHGQQRSVFKSTFGFKESIVDFHLNVIWSQGAEINSCD